MLVEAVWYDKGERQSSGVLADVVQACSSGDAGFVWAGLHEPSEAEITEITDVFSLHPLAVEDALKARQRPKVERYGEWLFIVVRTARYLDAPEEVEFGEIQMFAGPNAVVVIRHGEPVPLALVRHALEADSPILSSGPVAVVHAVLDRVVDAYHDCLAGLDDDVSEIELEVFAANRHPDTHALSERIYFLQREVLELHRALHPLADALSALRADRLITTAGDWDAYFRDIDDHLRRQQDQLSVLRELLAAALGANATQISLRQNEDMRRISAWVAIVAVPTMIAGIYGMNFEHMPELEWVGGYPVTLGIMATVCTLLYRFFKRSGWL